MRKDGYDGRGNLIREEMEGKLIHGYEYGAMNRLSKSWNGRGGESLYIYNGLGQRMGRSINGREEDYLLDLTKPYHNLMGIYKEEECSQRFYFDGTAAAMEGALKGKKPSGRTAFSGLHYYLQDELGSPLRVSGFRAKESAVAERNYYLTYGYDEFGNDLGEELEEAGIPNPYDGQGMEQPLGYTGYRYDEGSGTYFAQAREYLAGNGMFGAKDVLKGKGTIPETLNRYKYCFCNPLTIIDKNGMDGYYFYDPEMYSGLDSEGEEYTLDVEKIRDMDIAYLEEEYHTTIHAVAMDPTTNPNYTTFEEAWNEMNDSEEIEVVVILTHSNDNHFVTDSKINDDNKRVTTATVKREGIDQLEEKDINTLYLFGCNMGLTDRTGKDNNSLASQFYANGHMAGINEIIASDGSICHGYAGELRTLYVIPGSYHEKNEEIDGFKRYTYQNGALQVEEIDIRTYWTNLSDKGYSDSEEICSGKGKKMEKGKEKK